MLVYVFNFYFTDIYNSYYSCSGPRSGFTPCGLNGIITGAAQVFFSFIGFDGVTALAEEVNLLHNLLFYFLNSNVYDRILGRQSTC